MSAHGDPPLGGPLGPPPHAPGKFHEDAAVQKPALYLLDALGWGEPHNLVGEGQAGAALSGRSSLREVILTGRLAPALARLNPALAPETVQRALDILTEDRRALPPQDAAKAFHRLIRDGVRVKARNARGEDETVLVRVIDWRDPAANDFYLTEEFWVQGDLYRRRADVVGFVNGIPLLHMELKAPTEATKAAFDGNLSTYLTDIASFFTPNGLVILSNGLDAKVGAAFTPWDRFAQWKRVDSEADAPRTDLETTLRAVAAPARLLDIVENFTVFEATREGTVKKIAQNHQYLGVKNAVAAVAAIAENQGRLGVFWHTQGSGKSLSMAYFAANVLRHLEGGWTFVVVTDRTELDGQIYKTFRAIDLVTEDDARADSIADLRRLLSEDHRFVFTLIHKFQTRDGSPHPVLSERSNIIVMTDEAHRSQYDTLAMNMRAALPNAAFIGFTGTPLIAGEERTRDVFGDYVSIYDFGQSVEDGATVRLFYESRKPELHLDEEVFEEGLNAILEAAELDDEQEKELERRFAREYHLIVRPERLAIVAEDLADHFLARGHAGKAMMVCVDKATAIRMHDLVKARFAVLRAQAVRDLAAARDDARDALRARIASIDRLDMAVVVSSEQNEVKRMAEKGLDIVPHRKRMNEEDLEEKFKDPMDPLALVFVCAMWITGFDVPEISTVYLDKPMKNHTLMQTIARANRRAAGKEAGFIVDYIGVFRSLQNALAIYGGGEGGGAGAEPIRDKSALVEHLRALLVAARAFCVEAGADLAAVHATRTGSLETLAAFKACKEALISPQTTRETFRRHASAVRRVFKALLPDERAGEFAADCQLIDALARAIAAELERPDVDAVMGEVEALLDATISAEDYLRAGAPESQLYDLSAIDLAALQAKFAAGEPKSAAERLAALLQERVRQLAAVNPARADLLDKLRGLIERYNTGSINLAVFFAELQDFARGLSEEEGRGLREGLSDEELALFDILTKPDPVLTDTERDRVKAVARDFLARLKAKKLVLDWWKRPDARAEVSRFLRDELNDGLPDAYERDIFERKCDAMMVHLRTRYGQG